MKIHIAARREQRDRARRLAEGLQAAGHTVVSRWLEPAGGCVPLADGALHALTDLVLADCLVLLAENPWERKDIPGASERHVEFGYALRAGKRVFVLGPRETAFCHLPEVTRYRTVKEMVDGLR